MTNNERSEIVLEHNEVLDVLDVHELLCQNIHERSEVSCDMLYTGTNDIDNLRGNELSLMIDRLDIEETLDDEVYDQDDLDLMRGGVVSCT